MHYSRPPQILGWQAPHGCQLVVSMGLPIQTVDLTCLTVDVGCTYSFPFDIQYNVLLFVVINHLLLVHLL